MRACSPAERRTWRPEHPYRIHNVRTSLLELAHMRERKRTKKPEKHCGTKGRCAPFARRSFLARSTSKTRRRRTPQGWRCRTYWSRCCNLSGVKMTLGQMERRKTGAKRGAVNEDLKSLYPRLNNASKYNILDLDTNFNILHPILGIFRGKPAQQRLRKLACQ